MSETITLIEKCEMYWSDSHVRVLLRFKLLSKTNHDDNCFVVTWIFVSTHRHRGNLWLEGPSHGRDTANIRHRRRGHGRMSHGYQLLSTNSTLDCLGYSWHSTTPSYRQLISYNPQFSVKSDLLCLHNLYNISYTILKASLSTRFMHSLSLPCPKIKHEIIFYKCKAFSCDILGNFLTWKKM